MFLDINKIGRKGLSFDHSLNLPNLEGPAKETISVLRARMQGAARKGPRGVNLRARLETTLRLGCSRCLEPFHKEIASDFFLILVLDAVEFSAGEEQVGEEDVALFYTKQGRASLKDIATEQIYLNLPLKPICKEDCKGLCTVCGVNRNRSDCHCRSEAVDPRLAPLLQFNKQWRDA